MAGRRAQPPRSVAVSSLAPTGASDVDRVMGQADQALQDLQSNARILASRIDTTVAAIRTTGRLLAAPLVLTGSGSGTFPTGTCVVHQRGIGQGGGGGGAASTTGVSGGAGGSSGALLDIWIGTPGTPLSSLAYTWTSGTGAGSGGSTGGGNGAAGADSSIVINATTYTMKGGGGGGGCPNVVAPNHGNVMPTAPAAGTTTGGVVGYGIGGVGIVIGGAAWFSGAGGGTSLGAGGLPVGGAINGNPGSGMGGGGSGGAASGGVGRTGGAGAPGGFVLEVYS